MKTLKFIMALIVLTLMLSACAAGNATPTSGTPFAAVVSTDVASALTAQATLATSTSTSTPTPSPTPTLQVSSTSTAITNNIIPNTGSTGSICDNSIFIADATIPDGTVLAPDTAFTKTWTLKNIGNCTWSKSFVLSPVGGNSLGGSATQLPKQVAPGGSVDISVSMITPDVAGTYSGYWRLQNEAGTLFGEIVFVKIVVSNSVADEKELTPTPTKVISSTETLLPTHTAAPGNTSIPASTPKP